MNAGKKPVREWDTILVRVPDGLKDQIAQRARVNGRSAGAEAAAMLEEALQNPDEVGFIKLSAEVIRMRYEVSKAEVSLQAARERLQMLEEQLRASVPLIDENVDLTDYAARVYLTSRSRLNRDKIIRENRDIDELDRNNPGLSDDELMELFNRHRKGGDGSKSQLK
jgi:plasmid stability protein